MYPFAHHRLLARKADSFLSCLADVGIIETNRR